MGISWEIGTSIHTLKWGFPRDAVLKNPLVIAGDARHRFNPWVRMMPWSRKWQPTPVFLPGKSPWTMEPERL